MALINKFHLKHDPMLIRQYMVSAKSLSNNFDTNLEPILPFFRYVQYIRVFTSFSEKKRNQKLLVPEQVLILQ